MSTKKACTVIVKPIRLSVITNNTLRIQKSVASYFRNIKGHKNNWNYLQTR